MKDVTITNENLAFYKPFNMVIFDDPKMKPIITKEEDFIDGHLYYTLENAEGLLSEQVLDLYEEAHDHFRYSTVKQEIEKGSYLSVEYWVLDDIIRLEEAEEVLEQIFEVGRINKRALWLAGMKLAKWRHDNNLLELDGYHWDPEIPELLKDSEVPLDILEPTASQLKQLIESNGFECSPESINEPCSCNEKIIS